MSHPVSAAVRVAAAVDLPDWARRAVNLADARLGEGAPGWLIAEHEAAMAWSVRRRSSG